MITVNIIVIYLVEWETKDGEVKEEEYPVDFKNAEKFTDQQLDETGRRFLIGDIFKEGGRVIKIRKVYSREKELD